MYSAGLERERAKEEMKGKNSVGQRMKEVADQSQFDAYLIISLIILLEDLEYSSHPISYPPSHLSVFLLCICSKF